MTNFHKQKDYWEPCRPGTILGATVSKHQRERRRFLVSIAMGGVATGIGAVAASMSIFNSGFQKMADNSRNGVGAEANYATLPVADQPFICRDVVNNMAVYIAATRLKKNQQNELQQMIVLKVEEHLNLCKHCVAAVKTASRDA